MKRIIYIVFVTVLLLGSLAGCKFSKKGNDTNTEYSVAVAMLYGNHANNAEYEIPEIEFESGEISSNNLPFLHKDYTVTGICGVIIDGVPTECRTGEMNTFFDDFNTALKNKRYDTTQKYLSNLSKNLSAQCANDEEVNTLESLFVAANYFNQVSETTEKRMIIIDSGLSTSGEIDFLNDVNFNSMIKRADDLTEDEIESEVEKLYKNKEILDLSNVKVLWYGLGQVGGNQQELSRLQINNLKLIWQKVLEKSQVSSFEFITLNKSDSAEEKKQFEYPVVSTILLEKANRISSDILGFESDSDVLTDDYNKVRTELLSTYVQEGINNGLLIVGTTSTGGGTSDGIALSEKRVQAIKNELEKLGVPSYKIKTLGLGVKSHKYNENEYVDGNYEKDSEAAKENRSVYIMAQNSEEAELFYEDYKNLN